MLEPLGIKPATAIAAAIGAMMSLRFLDDLGPRQRVTAVCSGFISSIYLTPIVVNGLNRWLTWTWLDTQQAESGFAFIVGLVGLAVVGTSLKFIRTDLIDLIKGWFNGRR